VVLPFSRRMKDLFLLFFLLNEVRVVGGFSAMRAPLASFVLLFAK